MHLCNEVSPADLLVFCKRNSSIVPVNYCQSMQEVLNSHLCFHGQALSTEGTVQAEDGGVHAQEYCCSAKWGMDEEVE